MFWKNSKVNTWLCCLLGAFFLAAGICIQGVDAGQGAAANTTEAYEWTSFMETTEGFMETFFEESESQGITRFQEGSEIDEMSSMIVEDLYEGSRTPTTEMPAEAEGIYEENRDVYETFFGEPGTEEGGIVTSEMAEDREETSDDAVTANDRKSGVGGSGFWMQSWMRMVFLLAGVILSGMYIVLLRQKRPYLGPEAEISLLSASVTGIWLMVENMHTYGSVVYVWLLCIVLLVCARGIWGWLLAGMSVKWSGVHRTGLAVSERTGKKSWYLAVQMMWCMAAAIAALVLLRFWQLQQIRIVLWGICFVIMALASICLAGAFRDVDHLTEQISQMHQGGKIPIQEGIFSACETRLVDFNRQHEEAVQTAVSSERFRVDLIANVSHDLRTPLTAILGYGELLQKEELSAEGSRQLSALNQKAGYMQELVESLFELTKVSSGVIACKKEQIDLIRLLEQTIGLFDDKLHAGDVQIRRHYCVESLPVVTDGARMHQVFANLIGNAIKYTLKGTRIHLEVKEEADCCRVRLVNIASYEMDFQPEEIVQRFARGDKARTTKGSGLGLAIAQTYTESVGGTFTVSVDGEQFAAVVTLPKTEA